MARGHKEPPIPGRGHGAGRHTSHQLKVQRNPNKRRGTFGLVGSGSRNERMAESSGASTAYREHGKRGKKGIGRTRVHVSMEHPRAKRRNMPGRGRGPRK